LEKISTIQIEKNGIRTWISPEQHIDCSEFKLDTKKVRKFFSRAKIADKRAAHSTLDASLCETSGTLKFASGKQAHWTIGHLQDGWLAIGDKGLLLYCPTCKFKPFVY
jgi:predicted RNase H-like nuclease